MVEMNVGKGRKEWRHFAEVDKRRERDKGSQSHQT